MGFECRTSSSCKTNLSSTISKFLLQVLMIEDVSERLMKLDDYICRLEDEMQKIVAFKNELPLSMLILDDAIVAVREEAMQCRKMQTVPVLEQFIPLKKICEEEDDEKVEILKETGNSSEKMSWMSSVQLWNSNSKNKEQGTDSDTRKRIDDDLSTMKSCESQYMGCPFRPSKGCNGLPLEVIRKEQEPLQLVPELSLRTPGIKSSRNDILANGLSFKAIDNSRTGSSSISNGQLSVPIGCQSQQQSNRKDRRCWSPELHRQFVAALEQLGGAKVATPKQIRDIMQVDCLTNDEVKSHLQKYRLHIRKDPATKGLTQDHSLAMGGLWSSEKKFCQTPKQSSSQSGSPHGPFQSDGNSREMSMSAGHGVEDEDDEKCESGSWKNHHVHSFENESL